MSSGKAIINERNTEIKAQNNDWGTENEDEISGLVTGEVDTQYHLVKKSINAYSLACVVECYELDPFLWNRYINTTNISTINSKYRRSIYLSFYSRWNLTIKYSTHFTAKQIISNIPQGEII
jgi:hypothetical protein